jgi:hypothetical protein
MNDDDSITAVLDRLDVVGLDDEDKARVMTTFLGHGNGLAPGLHHVHATPNGQAPMYIFADQSGMVYIRD